MGPEPTYPSRAQANLNLPKKSGLVKSIGAWAAVLFGIHCISLSSSGFIPFSWVASVWPGASIVGVLTISMLVSLVHGYTFAAIGTAMPRSGADYVLASRLIHPALGFVASWTLLITSIPPLTN
jgi:amino acid transporter